MNLFMAKMGWYTRRIGLATIFKITELYMLQDTSSQHVKTWDFLNNRMEEAIQIQNILVETSNITDKVQSSFGAAFVTVSLECCKLKKIFHLI